MRRVLGLLANPARLRNVIRLRLRMVFRNNADIFDEVYRGKHWPRGLNQSDGIYSGSGSLPKNTERYEEFVGDFMIDHGIRTVVDLGCGDFQVSRRILDRVLEKQGKRPDYIGVDVSSVVVKRNRELFGGATCSFMQADATKDPIPQGDLLLCREVLQHLSNADVQRVIDRLSGFPFALISNTIIPDVAEPNRDIWTGAATRMKIGSSLELTRPPFNLDASEVLRVPHATSPHSQIVTLLWQRQA